ncbi:MAG: MoaD/ThiS family protein [Nitrososphaerota archaeon]|nr:MoaD/ThiS family protein [Nitrososphaerota archaeon]MDG6916975.1 MoaD/ThiS family protein [Nitrososphaerota archaeon]MDG6947931.1 MoaD/ThiS family protein [Nitrososphaerota archaeon]MDG6949350.1 MoaD/ThiS family protein [Nitrososphaerota archaeon]
MGSVTVLYFAGARDAVGKRREVVNLEGKSTAGDLLDRLLREYPRLRPMKATIRLSINQEVVDASAPVADGDEVGVLPPVAGG